ncbi:sulfatase-like hydrolase/transferase [Planctomycetota bacterium]|nr:sulfatase-like hydrolase/transferase [bacterium]MDB2575658.1 sulfatase-like hydrolase/transferase [Planctomycetota bacterium]MDB4450531.1 sulfatase-like hydrolase/transferase [bacterium]
MAADLARDLSIIVVAIGLVVSGCGGAEPQGVDPGGAASLEGAERVPLPGGEVPDGLLRERPNLLVITIDTLRADHLGAYGYMRPTSPRLDELAAESVLFERALAPVATTLPSHTTMFTGVSPHEHGVLANIADGKTYRRRPDLQTLAELFAESGYRTDAVVAAFPLRPEFGLDAGFDGYSAPEAKPLVAKDVTTAALAVMERQVSLSEPGMLWVHFFDPHGPYTPPSRVARGFMMDEPTRAYLKERRFEERAQRPTGQWNDLEKGVDAYDGEVAFVDRQIKRLLSKGAELGWVNDDCVIAVLGDHGEGLNQHGAPGHGQLWEEQLHVPWMIRAPGVAPRRIPGPVTLADFAPTLLHLFDLPGKGALLDQVTGVDRFAPMVAHADLRVVAQTSPRQSAVDGIGYAIRAGKWKLHRGEASEVKLFDLEADPFELEDVSPRWPQVVDRLSADLDAELQRQILEVRTEEASDATAAELRALGYGGDDR